MGKYRPKRIPSKRLPLDERLLAYFEDATLEEIHEFFCEDQEPIEFDGVIDAITELCMDLDW